MSEISFAPISVVSDVISKMRNGGIFVEITVPSNIRGLPEGVYYAWNEGYVDDAKSIKLSGVVNITHNHYHLVYSSELQQLYLGDYYLSHQDIRFKDIDSKNYFLELRRKLLYKDVLVDLKVNNPEYRQIQRELLSFEINDKPRDDIVKFIQTSTIPKDIVPDHFKEMIKTMESCRKYILDLEKRRGEMVAVKLREHGF